MADKNKTGRAVWPKMSPITSGLTGLYSVNNRLRSPLTHDHVFLILPPINDLIYPSNATKICQAIVLTCATAQLLASSCRSDMKSEVLNNFLCPRLNPLRSSLSIRGATGTAGIITHPSDAICTKQQTFTRRMSAPYLCEVEWGNGTVSPRRADAWASLSGDPAEMTWISPPDSTA